MSDRDLAAATLLNTGTQSHHFEVSPWQRQTAITTVFSQMVSCLELLLLNGFCVKNSIFALSSFLKAIISMKCGMYFKLDRILSISGLKSQVLK